MSKILELLQQRQQEKFNTNPLEAFNRSLTNAATLGTYPKIQSAFQAGVAKLGGDEDSYSELYGKKLKEQRELQRYLQENYPTSTTAGGFAGGAALPILPVGKSLGGTAQGAIQGGAYGGAEGILGSDDHRLESAVVGTTLGAGLGGAVSYIGGLVGKAFKNKKAIPDAPEASLETSMLAEEGGVAVPKAQGKNIEDIYVDPNAGYFANLSEDFSVPLTKGQLTGDSNTLFKEEAAKIGKFGTKLEGQAKNFVENQNQAISNATNSLNKKISGDVVQSKGARINESIEPILKQENEDANLFNQLYTEVAETPTQIKKDVFNGFSDDIEKSFGLEGYTREIDTAKPVFQEVDRLTNILKNNQDLRFGNVFKYREGLNAKINSAKGDEKRLLLNLKRKLDDKLASIPEEAILNGDLAVLDKYKQANQLYSVWKDKYTAKNSKDYAGKFIEDLIENRDLYTDETIVNKILGGSAMGFDSQSAMAVNEIKKRVSPEAFKGLQGEALFKIIQPLADPKNLKAGIYNNNFKNLLKNNSSVMKTLFDKEQLLALKKLGEVSGRTGIRPFSKVNPSGTAPFESYLKSLAKKIPGAADLVDSWGANVNFKNNQVKELLQKGVKVPKDLTPFERTLYIGGTNNVLQEINTYNQNKDKKNDNPLSSLSDEELQNYIKTSPNQSAQPQINSIEDLQNLSDEELRRFIKGK